jgi:glycosidase
MMKKELIAAFMLLAFVACQAPKPPVEEVKTETEWWNNSTIYEVNLRQMTQEGTFKAFQEQHLDRLADLGVEIIWFMPLHPIGEKNRKGGLGSYYSVKDYTAVNPEHGTMEDFKALVDAAHAKGMKVIIDWVANHTAWDNVWVEAHPDWFTKDSLGNFMPPVADWSDVIDLNYDNAQMRAEMIRSMQFWLTDADIDGFRCDVAEWVPTDFWVEARAALDTVKPVFFLAEGEKHELHQAFHMTYSWSFHHLMNQLAKGEKGASDLPKYWASHDSVYAPKDICLQFITNHDENSWNGTAIERMGDNRKAFAVMSFTIPGMPLIYSGMEADIDKRLLFFEKDAIDWKDYPLNGFYKQLVALKTNNPCLKNGVEGGVLKFYSIGDERLIAYSRTKDEHQLVVLLNLSSENATVAIAAEELNGQYKDAFSETTVQVNQNLQQEIPANGYLVLVKQ